MKKLLKEKPKNYPPKALSDVDFDYDLEHPWLRAKRQNMPMIKLFTVFISLAWTYVLFNTSILSLSIASGITIVLCYLFYAEKQDDEERGHLRPNEMGDYWRARKAYLESKNENSD